MKLVFCTNCHSIFNLTLQTKWCDCRQSWGQYHADALHADVHGKAVPLGIANSSFARALRSRPKNPEGSPSVPGAMFDAFVIPENCPTVKVHKEQSP